MADQQRHEDELLARLERMREELELAHQRHEQLSRTLEEIQAELQRMRERPAKHPAPAEGA
jgi:hypothetical protein